MRLRFGECLLDTDLRELTRSGQSVPLSPKAFRLLEVLAERRPRAVAKQELRELVWPEATAGGTTLARLVNEVRAAIGDEARPGRFLRTVPRFGYAFRASVVDDPVSTPRVAARCAVQNGTHRIPLLAGENIIGRAAAATVCLASAGVSRRHARIIVDDARAVLEDLGSKNGTYLDARKIEGPTKLEHGDHIGIGPVVLVFSADEEDRPTDSMRRSVS